MGARRGRPQQCEKRSSPRQRLSGNSGVQESRAGDDVRQAARPRGALRPFRPSCKASRRPSTMGTMLWRRSPAVPEFPLDRADVLAIFDALADIRPGRTTSSRSSKETMETMRPNREEIKRRRAEREESIRRLRTRIARMKAEFDENRRAEAERSARRRRFFLFG